MSIKFCWPLGNDADVVVEFTKQPVTCDQLQVLQEYIDLFKRVMRADAASEKPFIVLSRDNDCRWWVERHLGTARAALSVHRLWDDAEAAAVEIAGRENLALYRQDEDGSLHLLSFLRTL